MRGLSITTLALSVGFAAGCAPRMQPMTGVAPLDATIPSFALPVTPQKISFKWELNDNSMVARGDGVARLGPPDHARVDLFLSGGFGAAAAILEGDSLIVPPGARGLDLVPPAPLLWAALGRLALPAVPDTVVRVSGDTLRATLGAPVQWRITSVSGQLTRVERVSGDRIVEFVDRQPGKQIKYELSGRRSLVLDIETQQPVAQFDPSIWRF
jgi:hypothetical protein